MATKAKKQVAPKSASKEAPAPIPEKPKETQQWYQRGSTGFDTKKQQDEAYKARKEKFATRFRLNVGEEATIIFVDSNPFWIHEHNLGIVRDGKVRYGNFVTCTQEKGGDCPICAEGDPKKRPTWTGYFTIIDTREYTKKDGTKVKNSKVMYPAKGTTAEVLKDLIKKRGDLTGCAFTVKRYGEKDSNCGVPTEFLKKIKLEGDKSVPFDYEKILFPPSDSELAALGYYRGRVVGSSEDMDREASEEGGDETPSLDDLLK